MVTHATWHVLDSQDKVLRPGARPTGHPLHPVMAFRAPHGGGGCKFQSQATRWMRRKLTYMKGIQVSLDLGFVGGLLYVWSVHISTIK